MRTLIAIVLLLSCLAPAWADNLVELRHVLSKQADGAISSKFASDNLWLSSEVVISDSDIERATVALVDQQFVIMLTLTDRGAKRFDKFAETHLGERIAISVRGKVVSAPIVREKKFGGQIQIVGNFSEEDAVTLVSALNAKKA